MFLLPRFACIVLLSIFSLQGYSQSYDSLAQRIASGVAHYTNHNRLSRLFVHFDKNVYTEYENAWFTAYLVSSDTLINAHHTLSVALVRNEDRSILKEERFVMAEGLAFGNVFLPDSLPAGDYTFIAYTNRLLNNLPGDVFTQPVTIRSGKEPAFITTLKLDDKSGTEGDSARVVVRAYTPGIRLLRNASVRFIIGDTTRPLKAGNLKTDAFGEAKFTVPLNAITAVNNSLKTVITHQNESKIFNLRLPVYRDTPIVKFYPEGGTMVYNQSNVVGWEVKNRSGQPMAVSAALYKGDKAIDTITTSGYGMGRFTIMPQKEEQYYVKLLYSNSDSVIYHLPAAEETGPVIAAPAALCADTLTVMLTDAPQNKWLLVIHNYNNVFLTSVITATGRQLTIKVPLTEVPKGVHSFTLVDSTGKAWVERKFFAHYDQLAKIEIIAGKQQYKTREKVTVKLRLANSADVPVEGVVSVACVQDNRLEVRKNTDIRSYFFLQQQIADMPFKSGLIDGTLEDSIFLEDVLLIKGWSRYSWREMMAAGYKVKKADTGSVVFRGKVESLGKKVRTPVELGIINDQTLTVMQTDSSGGFTIAPEVLVAAPPAKVRMVVNSKKQEKFGIFLSDPYKELNRKLASIVELKSYDAMLADQNSQSVLLPANERANRLPDVKVTTKKDNNFLGGVRNKCGDYVCQFGILNCPNHPYGYALPEKGQTYRQMKGSVVYRGCGEAESEGNFLVAINGINTHKEFYSPNYEQHQPTEPELLSTLYWNHLLVLNKNGEAEVSFYTSDIPGKFRFVAQGLSSTDFIYGNETFEVLPR